MFDRLLADKAGGTRFYLGQYSWPFTQELGLDRDFSCGAIRTNDFSVETNREGA